MMRGGPSFHKVDYSLRTNKSIERKMLFESISTLRRAFPISEYRYIGFGSMWFVDFILAHRLLDIRELVSIEHAENAERAVFNKPYECIDVRAGSCTEVVASIGHQDWEKPCVAWLDYDGMFDEDVQADVQAFLEKASAGSVIVISANANRSNYRGGTPDAPEKVLDSLRSRFGDCVPAELLTGNQKDIQASDFPGVLARATLNWMINHVRNTGRSTEGFQDRFVPLYSMLHVDNAPMYTVGGMITSRRDVEKLESVYGIGIGELEKGARTLESVADLIPLTPKEKLCLDRLLPCPESEIGQKALDAGIKLEQDVIRKYSALYRHFPLFLEAMF